MSPPPTTTILFFNYLIFVPTIIIISNAVFDRKQTKKRNVNIFFMKYCRAKTHIMLFWIMQYTMLNDQWQNLKVYFIFYCVQQVVFFFFALEFLLFPSPMGGR